MIVLSTWYAVMIKCLFTSRSLFIDCLKKKFSLKKTFTFAFCHHLTVTEDVEMAEERTVAEENERGWPGGERPGSSQTRWSRKEKENTCVRCVCVCVCACGSACEWPREREEHRKTSLSLSSLTCVCVCASQRQVSLFGRITMKKKKKPERSLWHPRSSTAICSVNSGWEKNADFLLSERKCSQSSWEEISAICSAATCWVKSVRVMCERRRERVCVCVKWEKCVR